MPRDSPPLPGDGIYQAILVVLVFSVLAGAVLALAGELVWHNEALSQAGTWMALVTGGFYAIFRLLGAREARRRARGDQPNSSNDDDGGPPRGETP